MSITPKNWDAFQHYKDRAPAWIKLHRGLLDDYAFSCLPVASRALAPLLWLLASEYEGGKITAGHDEIAFRFRMTEKELASALKPLTEKGFFVSASTALADCKQDAIPERENKKEIQEETEGDIRSVAVATRPSVDPFEEFWKAYPKRGGTNPRKPAEKKYLCALKAGADPSEILAAVKRFAEEERKNGHIGTPYIAQAMTWLNQQRWGDYAPKAPENTTGPPQPPRPGLPTDAELRAKYGQRNATPDTAQTNAAGTAERSGHAGEFLGKGSGDDPGPASAVRPGNHRGIGGIRSLGEVLRHTPGLASVGLNGGREGDHPVDDGAGEVAGVVR